MSSTGGGGINLPPIIQPIQVSVAGGGGAQGMFGNILRSAGGASSALGGVGASAMTMNSQVMRTLPTWRTAGDAMRQAGSLMMYSVAMPLIAIGKSALKAASDFEKSMALITGLVGIPAAEVAKMGEAVLAMAGEVGKTPVELAEALYFITSAGIKGAAALDTLEESAKAAAAGLGTTKTVADVVTSVMNAYPEGLYSAGLATDILVGAVREGKAEASSFAPAMGKVLPVAAAFGVTFQDAAAAVAALTRQGAPAGTAAIQLRQILASLLKPTAEAKAELQKYGLSAASLRETIQNEGLFAGLQRLSDSLGGNAEGMAKVFGNVRPLTAINALLGPSMSRNADIFDKLSSSAGDTDDAFKAVQKTASQKWAETAAELQVTMISIGNSLAPVSKSLASFGKILATAFGGLSKIPGLTKIIAGIAGMAIVVSIATRSLSTWIRMQYLTTIALQGLTGGMRNTQTQTVTNILTGKSYSYAQQQQIATTNAQRAATLNSLSPMQAMAMTMEEMTAAISRLAAVMAQNSAVTAESTAFNARLAQAQGYVVNSSTVMTDAIIAGDAALTHFDATVATTSGAVSTMVPVTASYTAALNTIAVATTGDAAATARLSAVMTEYHAAVLRVTGGTATLAEAEALSIELTAAYNAAIDAAMIATRGDAAATLTLVDAIYQYNLAIGTASGATAVDAAVTVDATVTNIAMEQSLWKKMVAAAADARGMQMGAVSTTLFGQAQLVAGVAVQALGAKLKSLMLSMGPLLLVSIGLGIIMHKFMSKGASEGAKSVETATDAIRGLEDQAGRFNPKPLVLGVDVQYNYGTAGAGGGKPDFGKFLFPNGTKDLTDAEQLIFDELEASKTRFKTVAEKINFAGQFAAQFDNPVTQKAAADYVSNLLNIDSNEARAELASQIGNVKTFVDGQIKRYSAPVGGDFIDSTNDNFFGPGKELNPQIDDKRAKELAKGWANVFKTTILKAAPDITQPLEDALSTGSVQQTAATLSNVYSNLLATSGQNEIFATAGLYEYTKAAVLAAGGTAKATTVIGLLEENAMSLDPKIQELVNHYKDQNGGTVDTTMSTYELLGSMNSLGTETDSAAARLNVFADDAASLSGVFQNGLNPDIEAASGLMNAYSEALKGVKRGQDALFGSKMDAIEAEIKGRDALRGTMDALKDSNGEWDTGTRVADKAKGSLVDLAKSVLDVGNAAYANGQGGADVAAARAANAIQEQMDMIYKNLKASGLEDAEINTIFNNMFGSDIVVEGSKVKFDTATIMQTFHTDMAGALDRVATGLETDVEDIGSNILVGIGTGMTSEFGAVETNAVEAMKKIIQKLKDYMIIKSPSARMAKEIGYPMAMGIADGLKNATPAAVKAISDHIKAVEAAGKQAAGTKGSTTTGTTIAPQDPFVTTTTTVSKQSVNLGQIYTQGIAEGIVSAKGVAASAVNTIYDILTQKKYLKKNVINAEKNGYEWTKAYAEGILNGQSNVKTSIIDLVQQVMQDVSDDLSTTTTTISAILDLSGAKKELTKFQNSNSAAMLQSGVSRAFRESANATAKFGGNQGTEVTRYERAQIADARKSSQTAQRDYALGKISYSELVDAQQAYASANAAASEASSEVVDAQNNVIDAQYLQTNSALLLAQEQMKVVSAQQALNTAYVDARINGTDAATALANLGAQAGITTTAIQNIVTSLQNIPGANMGLSPAVNALIPGAAQNKRKTKVTRAKWAKTGTSSGGGGGGGRGGGSEIVKAKGGPISPGRLTLVGESGPELITPNSAGTVTPYSVLERYARTAAHNSQNEDYGSNGNNINITVNNPTPEPASDSIARRMQNMSALGLFA